MAATFLPDLVKGCIGAVRFIKDNTNTLRYGNVALPLNAFQARASSIADSDKSSIAVLLASGNQGQVNTIVTRFVSGWGTDPWTGLNGVHNAVTAFKGKARTIANAAGSPTIDADGETIWPIIPLATIQTLYPELDALLVACAVLEG
jgi:hypothetical protein